MTDFFDGAFTFDTDFDFEIEDKAESNIIEIPKYKYKTIVHYGNAEKLAKQVHLHQNSNHYIIVSGKFIMGDFYGYLLKENNLIAKQITVSSLSYSEQNIKSFNTLFLKGYIKKLNIIISSYFYAHERNKLIQFTYDLLGKYDFQLAVTRSHTKTCIFETENNLKFVIHGSPNLRSSGCEEQLQITECENLYNFVENFNSNIIKQFKTLKK
jgi:hypothetical protein